MTRTDIHSPSQIIPADYSFLFAYARPSSVDGWPVPGFNLDLVTATRTGRPFNGTAPIALRYRDTTKSSGNDGAVIRFSAIHKNGACDVCGAFHIEGSVFLHVPTGEAVALGWQCAENLDLDFDESERQLIAGDRKKARASAVAKAKRFAFLRHFVSQEKNLEEFPVLAALRVDHYITRDIRSRLLRQGWEPTEKQRALLLRLFKDSILAGLKGEEPEEKHVRAPIEEGRQRVQGLIVGVKVHDSVYGSSLKITVKVETPDGSWLSWGTAPSALLDLVQDYGGLRGATVAFDAELTRADRTSAKPDDSGHFTFFKRPTKPELLAVSSDEAHDTLARYQDAIDYCNDHPESTDSHLRYVEDQTTKRDKLLDLLA